MMMENEDPLFGVDGIGELLEEGEGELDVQKYLYRALAEHVEELSRENEELQAENRQLRQENGNGKGPDVAGLEFAFTTDNPSLQMDELRREIEALRQNDYNDSNHDNISIFTDSGNNSELGSHWNLYMGGSLDMSRVQRCQRKIADLEKEADQARRYNRTLMSDFADQLKDKARILGDSVRKARPYFDALRKSKGAKSRTSHYANQYTRAQQILKASRDVVASSEMKMMADSTNMQWLELLNEANERANQASIEKGKIQLRHEEAAQNYRLAEEVAAQLLKAERRTIKKATSYFDLKTGLEQKLEGSRKTMHHIDLKLVEAKAELSGALQRLGKKSFDSNELHTSSTSTILTLEHPPKCPLPKMSDDEEEDSIKNDDEYFFEDF